MFRIATGWLGWTPKVAWNTAIPEIFIALDGRKEWLRMTNGSGKPAANAKPAAKADPKKVIQYQKSCLRAAAANRPNKKDQR